VTGSPDHRFDEREVALILQETAALQERADRAGDAKGSLAPFPMRRGLTLAQLEQIAGEAGFDPALVRRAAASVGTPRTAPKGNPFVGAPLVLDVERAIDGELAEGAHEVVLEAVRRATGELGELTSFGRQFGWKGVVDGAKAQIAVAPGGGRTMVRVRLELDELANGSFSIYGALLGGFGGFLAGLATLPLGVIGLGIGGAVAGTGYFTARTIFKRTATRLLARAEETADEVAEAAKGEIDRVTG